MATTLIGNVTQLRNWLNSPSGTGQLTADITITVTTWTIPSGTLTAGIVLDGNSKTIFLENTTGSGYSGWPGLLKINGGTVKNLRMSGSSLNNAPISPSSLNTYFTNYVEPSTVANYDTVFFDGCVANYLYFYANIDNVSVFGSYYMSVNLTNCQLGRSKTDPMVLNGGQYSGFAMCNYGSFNITNCVFYTRVNGGNDVGIVSGIFSSGTVSNCIMYMYVENYGTFCAVMFGGRGLGNITVTNCYQFVDWGVSTSTGGYALPIMIPSQNNAIFTMQNSYTLINLVGSGSFASGNPVLNLSTGSTSNFTNVAYTRGFSYAAGGTINLTNCINTYTSSTPNSTEPINSFSATFWDKTVTPPTLKFNATSPWNDGLNAYNTPNVLSQFYNNPVITWTPSPSTLLYPSPLTTKQLNATADVTGTFVYTPPLGTILNLGASQTLSTKFTPTDPTYLIKSSTAIVSVVLPPYIYISNQNDLYQFLYGSNTSYTKGIFTNNINLDTNSWFALTRTSAFSAGRILDGNGYTLNIASGSGIHNFGINNGLIKFSGGTFRNCTITSYYFPTYSQKYAGIIAGNGDNGTLEFIAMVSTNFYLESRDERSFMVGDNCTFTFNSCQVGTSTNPLYIGSNSSGAFASLNFTGTFNDCLSYFYSNTSGSQGQNGGFIGSTAGNVSFNKCKSSGIMSDNVSGIQGGYVGQANHTVSFDNCYSIVDISGVSGNKGGGFVGGGTTNNTQLYFNNCYFYGTAGSCGTLVNANTNPFIISLYNVTANGTYLSNVSVSTNVVNNMVIQPWNNDVTQIGVNGTVYATAQIGNDIYVGGNFTSVNGDATIQYLARWNTTSQTWNKVGGGVVNGIVYTMTVFGSNLYIGGSFTVPGNRIAIWNGSSFSQISGDTFNGAVRTIYVPNANSVFIGGDFTLMNGATNMRYIARWTPSSWNELGVGGVNGSVYSIVSGGSDGPTNYSIIFGGAFTASNNGTPGTLNRLGYWASTFPFFSAIGTGTGGGVNGTVNTIIRSVNTIYFGGSFTSSTGGTTLNRWGTQNASNLANAITAIGSGTIGFSDGQVNQIILNGTKLYPVGTFTTAGGYTIKYIAQYDTSSSQPWSSVSNFFNNGINTVSYDGTSSLLYVGGNFSAMLDQNSNIVISNLNNVAQISTNYNKTDYAGTSSTTTIPVLDFNHYFTS